MRKTNNRTQKEMVELIRLSTGRDVSLSLYQKWEIQNKPVDPMIAQEVAGILDVEGEEITERK